jgi:hypothetical protein
MVTLIQSADRQVAMIVLPNACTLGKRQKTKLVFHRYGDRYFLAQVWTAGSDQGRELPKSRRETEIALDYPVQNVILAATLR